MSLKKVRSRVVIMTCQESSLCVVAYSEAVFADPPACVLLFVLESPEILIVGNWANGWDLLIEIC